MVRPCGRCQRVSPRAAAQKMCPTSMMPNGKRRKFKSLLLDHQLQNVGEMTLDHTCYCIQEMQDIYHFTYWILVYHRVHPPWHHTTLSKNRLALSLDEFVAKYGDCEVAVDVPVDGLVLCFLSPEIIHKFITDHFSYWYGKRPAEFVFMTMFGWWVIQSHPMDQGFWHSVTRQPHPKLLTSQVLLIKIETDGSTVEASCNENLNINPLILQPKFESNDFSPHNLWDGQVWLDP